MAAAEEEAGETTDRGGAASTGRTTIATATRETVVVAAEITRTTARPARTIKITPLEEVTLGGEGGEVGTATMEGGEGDRDTARGGVQGEGIIGEGEEEGTAMVVGTMTRAVTAVVLGTEVAATIEIEATTTTTPMEDRTKLNMAEEGGGGTTSEIRTTVETERITTTIATQMTLHAAKARIMITVRVVAIVMSTAGARGTRLPQNIKRPVRAATSTASTATATKRTTTLTAPVRSTAARGQISGSLPRTGRG